MVRKRAHLLRYKAIVASDGYRDQNDDWIPGETVESTITLKCRADVNSAGRTIPNHEGQAFVYSYEIFLDKIPDSLKRGLEVEILRGDEVILTGKVIMPFEYQTHSKVWV